MTHTICSVGFLLYLCEMEFKYDDLVKGFIYSFFGSTNPCVQITEEYIEYVDTCIRNKMGGDGGIHLGYRDNKK